MTSSNISLYSTNFGFAIKLLRRAFENFEISTSINESLTPKSLEIDSITFKISFVFDTVASSFCLREQKHAKTSNFSPSVRFVSRHSKSSSSFPSLFSYFVSFSNSGTSDLIREIALSRSVQYPDKSHLYFSSISFLFSYQPTYFSMSKNFQGVASGGKDLKVIRSFVTGCKNESLTAQSARL